MDLILATLVLFQSQHVQHDQDDCLWIKSDQLTLLSGCEYCETQLTLSSAELVLSCLLSTCHMHSQLSPKANHSTVTVCDCTNNVFHTRCKTHTSQKISLTVSLFSRLNTHSPARAVNEQSTCNESELTSPKTDFQLRRIEVLHKVTKVFVDQFNDN